MDEQYSRINTAAMILIAAMQILTLSRLVVAPSDVQQGVREMKQVLSNEILEIERRLSSVEITQAEQRGATRFRFTSLDFAAWHRELVKANDGREIVVPPFTTTEREDR